MQKLVTEGQKASWVDHELARCEFADARLGKRFKTLVTQLSEGVGNTIPMWPAPLKLDQSEC